MKEDRQGEGLEKEKTGRRRQGDKGRMKNKEDLDH